MARPLKAGLDYFPLDVDIDSDDKIQLIEGLYRTDGFATYMKLLMKIYSDGFYYKWGEKEKILMAKRIGISVELVEKIVLDCIKYGLFSEKLWLNHELLSSAGIQRRYFNACGKKKKGQIEAEYLLLDQEEILENCPEITFYSIIQGITPIIPEKTIVIPVLSTQTKLNKTKLNKTIYSANPTFFELFWKSYPKKEKKAKSKEWFDKHKVNQETFDLIMSKLEMFKKTSQWVKDGGKFIPQPITWLNQQRWEDEINLDTNNPSLPEWYADYESQLKQQPKSIRKEEPSEDLKSLVANMFD